MLGQLLTLESPNDWKRNKTCLKVTQVKQRMAGNKTTNDWKWHNEWLGVKQKCLKVTQRMIGSEQSMIGNDGDDDDDLTHW